MKEGFLKRGRTALVDQDREGKKGIISSMEEDKYGFKTPATGTQ
jgi:hypothetical protein